MLLQVREIGIKGDHRLYSVQTPRGLSGIVDLTGQDLGITVLLAGTYYRRIYPATAPLPDDEPPRIRDLEGGYQTIQTFVSCWEHATAEQRELLCENGADKSIYTTVKHGKTKRTNRKLRQVEDRPVTVPVKQDGTWCRAYVKDLRTALKGLTAAQTVRIGQITVRRSVLYDLVDSKSALAADPILELSYTDGDTIGGALNIRSVDGRARVTLKHGAGDKYHGAQGFDRRIQFVAH